ncbi:MAG: hypothetical protein BWY15_00826 [Firmicutes bacterium ADurb.Bin193]|nr:MAG: hypothetical protein BWY15_00826 [Firmicutes bacterium ADurb.Bin193]
MDSEAFQVVLETINKSNSLDRWIVLFSVIAVICSALSPVATTLIRKNFDEKCFRQKLAYTHKLDIYSKIISALLNPEKLKSSPEAVEDFANLAATYSVLGSKETYDRLKDVVLLAKGYKNDKEYNKMFAYSIETLLALMKEEFSE